jgi:hypothetical protein
MPLTAEPQLRAATRRRLLNPFSDQQENRRNVFGEDDEFLSSQIRDSASNLNFDIDGQRTARSNIVNRTTEQGFDNLARRFSLDPGGLRQGRAIRVGGTLEANRVNALDSIEADLLAREGQENRANASTLSNLQTAGRTSNLQLADADLRQLQAGADFITDRERSELIGREIDSKENQNIIGGAVELAKLLEDQGVFNRNDNTGDGVTGGGGNTGGGDTGGGDNTTERPILPQDPITGDDDDPEFTFVPTSGDDGTPTVFQFPWGDGQGRQLPDGRVIDPQTGFFWNASEGTWQTRTGDPVQMDEQGMPIAPEPVQELDSTEMVEFIDSFNSSRGSEAYDHRFDFNGDGHIGFEDQLEAFSRASDPEAARQAVLERLGIENETGDGGNVTEFWESVDNPEVGSVAETAQNFDWADFPDGDINLLAPGAMPGVDADTRIALQNIAGSDRKLNPAEALQGLATGAIDINALEKYLIAHPDFEVEGGKIKRKGGNFLATVGNFAVAALTSMGYQVAQGGEQYPPQGGGTPVGSVNLDVAATDPNVGGTRSFRSTEPPERQPVREPERDTRVQPGPERRRFTDTSGNERSGEQALLQSEVRAAFRRGLSTHGKRPSEIRALLRG